MEWRWAPIRVEAYRLNHLMNPAYSFHSLIPSVDSVDLHLVLPLPENQSLNHWNQFQSHSVHSFHSDDSISIHFYFHFHFPSLFHSSMDPHFHHNYSTLSILHSPKCQLFRSLPLLSSPPLYVVSPPFQTLPPFHSLHSFDSSALHPLCVSHYPAHSRSEAIYPSSLIPQQKPTFRPSIRNHRFPKISMCS